VASLPNHIQDPELRSEVEALCVTARDKASFAIDWRNRHIAHRDLMLTLRTPAKPLEPASHLNVGEAITAIAAVTQPSICNARDGSRL
jgi:hypothetical protein